MAKESTRTLPDPRDPVASTPPTAPVDPAAPILPADPVADPARKAAAFSTMERRRLHVRHVGDGRWRAYTEHGTAIGTADHPDPVLAVERAEEEIVAGEGRAAEVQASGFLDLLHQARYMPWPQVGKKTGDVEWVVLQVDGERKVGGPHPGLIPALLQIRDLLSAPTP